MKSDYYIHYVCPSVRVEQLGPPPQGGFSLNLIYRLFFLKKVLGLVVVTKPVVVLTLQGFGRGG